MTTARRTRRMQRARRRGFRPTDLGGCILSLDASRIPGLSDGDLVSFWRDESFNGHSVSQDTDARKPVFKTGVRNGLPVLRFNSNEQFLSLDAADASALQFNDVTPYTAGGVFTDHATGSQIIVCLGREDRTWFSGQNTFNSTYEGNRGSTRHRYFSPTGLHHLMSSYDSATLRTWLDNGNMQSTDTTESLSGTSDIVVGTTDYDGYAGDICELYAFSRPLAPHERHQLHTYLARKWAL